MNPISLDLPITINPGHGSQFFWMKKVSPFKSQRAQDGGWNKKQNIKFGFFLISIRNRWANGRHFKGRTRATSSRVARNVLRETIGWWFCWAQSGFLWGWSIISSGRGDRDYWRLIELVWNWVRAGGSLGEKVRNLGVDWAKGWSLAMFGIGFTSNQFIWPWSSRLDLTVQITAIVLTLTN